MIKNKYLKSCFTGGLIGAIAGAYIGMHFHPIVADGPCLEPNVHDRDILFVEEFPLIWTNLNRGDLVSAINPKNGSLMVKRLAALPGDSISFNHHNIVLGNGEYWLLGDNKDNSYEADFSDRQK